ncbi:hypothetical protein D9619_005036 [Psilocybe cf. subviscida]|uniref:Ankyrin repeat protein n=1 Tax=Psilocybe cf. subviscida TaxID=2480587 RepID=A0A8H5F8G8_9AGAR|nr:hypothetical protein D9619_005036 [Psilocybe cf. subviscida]
MDNSESFGGPFIREYLSKLAALSDTGNGRTLEELKKSKGTLKGEESQRLRTFCTSHCMDVHRDLDEDGRALLEGKMADARLWHSSLVMMKRCNNEISQEAATKVVANIFAAMRWGPTVTPLYYLLFIFTQIVPQRRAYYLALSRYFIDEAKVPVDSRDLSGTTALGHCFSTKPSFDLEYAQMLVDAGADINARNRYGGTVAHAIVQIYDQRNPAVVRRAREALQFFLKNGGNVDIADGDGHSPRSMLQTSVRIHQLQDVVDQEDDCRAILDLEESRTPNRVSFPQYMCHGKEV